MRNFPRTLVFTALLCASGLALAGPEHRSQGAQANPAQQPAREFAGMLRQLDLSPEQQAEVKAIFSTNKDALEAQAEASRALREDLQVLLGADVLDENALADLAEMEGKLAEERVMLMGTLAADVLAELDDEQRAELQALREERLARRDEWRQKRAGKPGMSPDGI